ncbi:MAG: hypothetical protein AAGF12_10845 [Myxococcota bacterium]
MLSSSGVAAQELDAEEQALLLSERSREHYEAGEYERCALLIREAIDLHDDPILHYNLARTLERLDELEEARDEYVTVLDMMPNFEERAQVEERIQALELALAEQSAAVPPPREEPPPVPLVPEPAETSSVPLAPWIVLGAGVLIAAGGIPFAVLFQNSVDDVDQAPDHRTAVEVDRTVEYAVVANSLFGVGAVTAIVGLVWGLLTLPDDDLPVALSPAGPTLRTSLSF